MKSWGAPPLLTSRFEVITKEKGEGRFPGSAATPCRSLRALQWWFQFLRTMSLCSAVWYEMHSWRRRSLEERVPEQNAIPTEDVMGPARKEPHSNSFLWSFQIIYQGKLCIHLPRRTAAENIYPIHFMCGRLPPPSEYCPPPQTFTSVFKKTEVSFNSSIWHFYY